MAKKTKTERLGEMIGVVLVIAALGIMICVALLPLILLIGSIYCYAKFARMKRNLRNHLSDFWLSDEEREDFKNNSMARAKSACVIAEQHRKAREANVPKNKDGQYSIRSYLGKDIRQQLQEGGQLLAEMDEALQALKTKPLNRWEEFNSMASTSKAFYGSLIVWLAIVSYYVSSAHKEGVLELNCSAIVSYLGAAYADVFLWMTSLGGRKVPHIVHSLQIIGYSCGGAIVSFLVFKGVFCNHGSRFSPKPPMVTLSNLDLAPVPANGVAVIRPNQVAAPPGCGPPSPQAEAKVPSRLKVVGVCNTVVGILSLLWAGVVLLGVFCPPRPLDVVFLSIFFLSAISGIMQLLAGASLRKGRAVSGILGLIASILGCFSVWCFFVFPLCLICGFYTLIVLRRKDIAYFLAAR